MEDLLKNIQEKYAAENEPAETYLTGLLHARPLTYWDYVNLDTLLTLQQPKTHFPDEQIFIMYHQLTELLLKLILHELDQVTGSETPSADLLIEKINRMNSYLGICTSSYKVMGQGMSVEQYNQFRMSLAPASGFQSAQFRLIELASTDSFRLVSPRWKARRPEDAGHKWNIDHAYWQDAGTDWKTGEKSLMMRLFIEKYEADFLAKAENCEDSHLRIQVKKAMASATEEQKAALKAGLRAFDREFNIAWPMAHLATARHYLLAEGERRAATGGSHWEKYLHPKYQRRIFFPEVWTEAELENWGEEG